jgi:hypothetical protein
VDGYRQIFVATVATVVAILLNCGRVGSYIFAVMRQSKTDILKNLLSKIFYTYTLILYSFLCMT